MRSPYSRMSQATVGLPVPFRMPSSSPAREAGASRSSLRDPHRCKRTGSPACLVDVPFGRCCVAGDPVRHVWSSSPASDAKLGGGRVGCGEQRGQLSPAETRRRE